MIGSISDRTDSSSRAFLLLLFFCVVLTLKIVPTGEESEWMPINTIIRGVLCEIIGSRSGTKKKGSGPNFSVSALGGLSVAMQETG